MNTLTDQLKKWKMTARNLFEREQAIQDLKAHDIEVGKLLGLK